MNYKKVFGLIAIFSMMAGVNLLATTKEYVADVTTDFCNPERGFYDPIGQDMHATGSTNLTAGQLQSTRSKGRTLVLREYWLGDFATSYLTDDALNVLLQDFQLCRENGTKLIIRFGYTEDDSKQPYQDGNYDWWIKHLDQLKPILAQGEDVISCVQAGFLGVWGEWYYSYLGTGNTIPQEKKNGLIDKLLECVPASRAVQLRTPDYKHKYLGDSEALTAEEAFTGTPKARLGHHNDAILNGSDNMGTYRNRKKDMRFLNEECRYLPNGGETDLISSQSGAQGVYDKYSTGEIAYHELGYLHFSYLCSSYSGYVLNKWRNETCPDGDSYFNLLSRSFGYRYNLMSATIPSQVKENTTLPIILNIKNVGFASPFNERHAYIVLVNENDTLTLPIASDPRLWESNGAITTINENLILPQSAPKGIYQAYLWMPDNNKALAAIPEFAIRFANVDMWNEKNGWNNLDLTVEITDKEPQIDPEPVLPEPSDGVTPVADLEGVCKNGIVELTWTNPSSASLPTKTLPVDLSQPYELSYHDNCHATPIYNNGQVDVTYSTSNTWYWAGFEVPVDNLEDVLSVSFEYKGDGKNANLVAYISDGEVNWYADGSDGTLKNTTWTENQILPEGPLWNEGQVHQYGTKPIKAIGFRANPASAMPEGAFSIRNVTVVMKNGEQAQVGGVRVIRNVTQPTSLTDGELIYNGQGSQCKDIAPQSGTYYYAAYAYDTKGNYSLPTFTQISVYGDALPTVKDSSMKVRKILSPEGLRIVTPQGTFSVLGTKIQ